MDPSWRPNEERELLSGSQAVGRGALEAGARLATGYPGTPATPAISYLIDNHSSRMRCEWAVNEKVALEVAAGHSLAGQASFVAMKMSGLNVASDSLASIAASGTPGPLVIMVGDDPGAYYGMAEQDSRHIARLASLPMVEPSTPAEALELSRKAFKISDETQAPILIRQTTVTANTMAPVPLTEPERQRRPAVVPDDKARYTKVSSADCRRQHSEALQRLDAVARALDHLNISIEAPGSRLGVVATGSTWSYLLEALEERDAGAIHAQKVAVVNPLPDEKLTGLLGNCDKILVVEELDPLIEERLRALAFDGGFKVEILGKSSGHLPTVGDISPDMVEAALCALEDKGYSKEVSIPDLSSYAPRKPNLCPGCPHRSSYTALQRAISECGYSKDEVLVTGDIGCTILGMNEPFSLCRTEYVMGASIAMGQGFFYAGVDKPVVAAIGDSTFFHAGIPALLNAASRGINLTVLVLDNSYAAMTGFQPTLSTEREAHDLVPNPIGIQELVKASRVNKVRRTSPFFTGRLTRLLTQALKAPGVNVVIAEGPCASRRVIKKSLPYRVREEKCVGLNDCEHSCLDATGCPAIFFDKEGSLASIDPKRCMGCGLCASACAHKAITRKAVSRKVRTRKRA